jgi:two-component system, response regulator
MGEMAKLVRMLLVEDNPDDIVLIQRAIKQANIVNQMWVVRDGQEAVDFLRHQGPFQDESVSPRPGLILLDINIPKINGLEVLQIIKQDNGLKGIPTVMLTVSRREEDIIKGYNYGCNSFVQKPLEFEKFVDAVKQIGMYWGLLNVEVPHN